MNVKGFLKKSWLAVVCTVITVVVWGTSCGSCSSLPSPETQLRDATVSAHRAAAAELAARVELARVELAAAPAPRQALAGVDLGHLVEAVRRYVEAVRSGQWQDGLVSTLREAATQYEAVRQLFPPLPPLPPIVRELLIVEECR